jgi:hypothetical protein
VVARDLVTGLNVAATKRRPLSLVVVVLRRFSAFHGPGTDLRRSSPVAQGFGTSDGSGASGAHKRG